jgi:Ca2+-binding EF-hand superfamily protein
VCPEEIEEMISTVDRNGDGKISYSEFRVMLGAFPLIGSKL